MDGTDKLVAKLHKIQDIFAESEVELRKTLEAQLESRSEGAILDADVSRIVDLTLYTIGIGVEDAIAAWKSRASTKFYFWPGYQRVEHNAGRAIMEDPTPTEYMSIMEKRTLMAVGRGVRGPHTFTIDAQVVWFNLLLDGRSELYRQIDLAPPSTHLWLENGCKFPLPALMSVVFDSSALESKRHNNRASRRYLTVPLSRSKSGNWAFQMQARLRRVFEPRNSDSRLPPWPAHRQQLEVDFSPGQNEVHDAIRLLIYEVWLAAVFAPRDILAVGFIDRLLQNSRPAQVTQSKAAAEDWNKFEVFLRGAVKRVRDAGVAADSGYQCWYCLPINAPTGEFIKDGRPGAMPNSTYLGTVMVLSGEALDPVLLDLIGGWVRSMYLQLRSVETNARERASGAIEISNSFGHEVAKLGTGLLTNTVAEIEDVLTWMPAPLRLSADLTEEQTAIVKTWKIVTAPLAYEGFEATFHAWGSVPLAEWNLEPPFNLHRLVEILSSKTRSMAASRYWVDWSRLPKSIEMARLGQETMKSLTSQRPQFEVTIIGYDDIIFDRGGSYQFLVRLFMAAMSNAAYHAPSGSSIKISGELYENSISGNSVALHNNERMLKVNIKNDVDASTGTRRNYASQYAIKTDGVLRACLNELGGRLIKFPNHSVRGVAETEFLISTKLVKDRGDAIFKGAQQQWIKFYPPRTAECLTLSY